MCIVSAWEVGRNRSGIKGMESIRPNNRIHPVLPTVADMLNHRGEIGLQVHQKLGDVVQPPLDRVQARPWRPATACAWLACYRRPVALEHLLKVLWWPAERHRQGFQGSRLCGGQTRRFWRGDWSKASR